MRITYVLRGHKLGLAVCGPKVNGEGENDITNATLEVEFCSIMLQVST